MRAPTASVPARIERARGRLATVGVALLGLTLAAATVALDETAPANAPTVVAITLDSIIQPVAAEFVLESLEEADRLGAEAFVIELSTPGGLLTSTREITTAMLGAATPTVVYVAPSGAQAASAGFFILMAADVAAMAPSTNTGAAHPVGGQGEEIEGTLGEKVEQDAAATIRTLSARVKRNQELAEAAVVESRSFSETEALEGGLIELVSPSLEDLLAQLDGRVVSPAEGVEKTLHTAGAVISRLEMTAFQKARSTLVHPNIAYMLMTLGGLGLYFELANPGAIFPGVIGVIFLILAFYSMSVLPVNYAGFALMVLAGVLFLLEIKVQSFGLLTAGGLVSLVLGSLMLFESPDPALRVSIQLVYALAALAAVVVAGLVVLAWRARKNKVRTGSRGMIEERGVVRTPIGTSELETGKVSIHGELWNAVAEEPIAAGERVEVVAVEGLTLRVKPLRSGTEQGAA